MHIGKLFAKVLLLALLVLLEVGPGASAASTQNQIAGADPVAYPPDLQVGMDAAAWTEPRGLNIVDLVGSVPESDLAGAIISSRPGYGIVRYQSGERQGDRVIIRATAFPSFVVDGAWNGSMFGCLGQGPRIDQLGSGMPASRLRAYLPDGTEVTRQVNAFTYLPSAQATPLRNPAVSQASNTYRYWVTGLLDTQFTPDGALSLPANMGCELIIARHNYRELRLVFEMEAPRVVAIQVLGREDLQFPVYTGPGYAGLMDPLRGQLGSVCPNDSSGGLAMHPPPGAEYFFVNLPPVPVDPYTIFPGNPTGNFDRPSSGTYRIRIPIGLSVDHVNAMGLPVMGHWKDMDLSGGASYLPYTRYLGSMELEYLVSAGVPYDPCMLSGTCSREKLLEICHTPTRAKILYLTADRISGGLTRLPVRMVGPSWGPSAAWAAGESTPGQLVASGYRRLFPIMLGPHTGDDDNNPAGCSPEGGCGWFTADARMVDYIPAP